MSGDVKIKYVTLFLFHFFLGTQSIKLIHLFNSPHFLRLLIGFVVFLLVASIRATLYYKKRPPKNSQTIHPSLGN